MDNKVHNWDLQRSKLTQVLSIQMQDSKFQITFQLTLILLQL